MKFSAFFLFLTFLSSALAVPFHALVKRELGLSIREDQHGGPGKDGEDSFSLDEHPWIPADFIKGASRSPCPFLNTMANHGFLCVETQCIDY
jgi:hypothetical protein